jgi:hypothetical protein
MGYSENATGDWQEYHRGTGFQSKPGRESHNGVNRREEGSPVRHPPPRPDIAGPSARNIIPDHALLSRGGAARHYRHSGIEVTMATRRQGQIVETPTEARQAEPGPSVLALLTISTGLAVLILGVVWFVFFHT